MASNSLLCWLAAFPPRIHRLWGTIVRFFLFGIYYYLPQVACKSVSDENIWILVCVRNFKFWKSDSTMLIPDLCTCEKTIQRNLIRIGIINSDSFELNIFSMFQINVCLFSIGFSVVLFLLIVDVIHSKCFLAIVA